MAQKSSENYNFSEIANKIYGNFEKHEKNIKKFCIKSTIISANNFYEGYENEIKEINSEITPSKDINPSIADFADLFKSFDEYPANMQKAAKKPQPKEVQRINSLNSTIMKGYTTPPPADANGSNVAANATQQQKDSLNAAATATDNKSFEDTPTASETFNGFKKFQQKLKIFQAELEEKAIAGEYKSKLTQLQSFAQQLEKLMPTHRNTPQAFSAEEEELLRQLAENVEALKFIQNNDDIFQHTPGETNLRLKSLMDIMSYLIKSISSYNN